MSEMATYIGVTPRTVIATNADIVRGVRVTRNSSGFVAVQDATARGDYVTAGYVKANLSGQAFDMQSGKVPALTTVAVAVGDLAYTAASGQFTNVSTNAVLVGRFTLATAGAGMAEVELFTAA